jgi:hypothetical protein
LTPRAGFEKNQTNSFASAFLMKKLAKDPKEFFATNSKLAL